MVTGILVIKSQKLGVGFPQAGVATRPIWVVRTQTRAWGQAMHSRVRAGRPPPLALGPRPMLSGSGPKTSARGGVGWSCGWQGGWWWRLKLEVLGCGAMSIGAAGARVGAAASRRCR